MPKNKMRDLLDRLRCAESKSCFRTIASDAASFLGYDWYTYVRQDNDRIYAISSLPSDWTDYCQRTGHAQLDPALPEAISPCRRLFWSADSDNGWLNGQRSRITRAAQIGIRSGMVVPVHDIAGEVAAFTLCSSKAVLPLENQSTANMIQWLGSYFHVYMEVKLSQPGFEQAKGGLTARERECLTWTARGKTAQESAMIVGITERTVIFHLNNAREKLNAVTLPQAVAQAVRSGMVPP